MKAMRPGVPPSESEKYDESIEMQIKAASKNAYTRGWSRRMVSRARL